MNQKAFLALAIFGVILVSGCIGEKSENISSEGSGGRYMKTPVPVYESNQAIDSDAKAQQVFNENFNAIINATKQTVVAYSNLFSGIKVSCIENNDVLFDKINFERMTYQNGNESVVQYRVKVYIAEKGAEWKEENGNIVTDKKTCKEMTVNETTGERVCDEFIQSREPSYSINYIMYSDGTITLDPNYGYCPTN